MLAKKTEENDESLEDTMDKSSDIFDTPRARCLKLKTEFLRRARDYKFWGRDNSRQRVIALDTVLRYCRQSTELAEWGTELRKDVDTDIESFLLEEHVLPVPRSIRAKLKEEFASTGSQTQGVAFMMAMIEELRTNALTEFEKEEWSEKEEFYKYSFALRELRKKIYTGKWVSGYNEDVLFEYIDEYELMVNQFLKRFKKMLSKREVCIWKKKLQDTVEFVDIETNPEYFGEALSEADENTSKSNTVQEKLENHVPEKTIEETPVVPQVKEIFEAVKLQENLLENLPNVPADTDELFDGHNSVDENIEARLLKLKFFRKTWCSEEPTDQNEPEKQAPHDVLKSSKPKSKVEMTEDVPIYSNIEETEKFNKWYLQKIGFTPRTSSEAFDAKSEAEHDDVSSVEYWTELQAKVESESSKQDKSIDKETNTSADALRNKVQATKVEQDETPSPVSGVFMDMETCKEVDRDHTRNLFEGSTSVMTNPYMEDMFVLLFAIIKLINFSCPKLSYVPAVFPTQSQSYPDPSVPSYAPLPSSASGCIMGPTEMRLTKTSSSQVATSHVTEGYGSWLSGTIWGIFQRGKVGAGLRLIEAGEFLLA